MTARTGDRRALLLSVSLFSYLLLHCPSHSLCFARFSELGGSLVPFSAAGSSVSTVFSKFLEVWREMSDGSVGEVGF